MTNALAKTMAVVVGGLLVLTLGFLYVSSRPAAGAQRVVAEFRDAFPLLEGMHVRVDGAIAGSVGEIEVTEEGLAQVDLILDDSIEDPGADATAAIRQQDTTGDSYVAYEPGDAGEPLPVEGGAPTIACNAEGPADPCENSLAAPRFDDLLNSFGPPERAGVKLILGEVSRALDERGHDVNEAALELRPALLAANRALGEVNRQNDALRPLIEDAEAVTGQAASRRAELARLIDSLETTLAVTASETGALDAGLERLPATLTRAHSTLSALREAAVAGQPLARELGAGAGQLADAVEKAPDFLADADAVLERTQPTLELTRKLLVAATPTIAADPQRVVTGAFDLAPAISNLLTGALGDENTIKGLFGDDSGGVGPGTLDRFGLGAVTVEPGNQAGYPAEHVDRNFFRISAVLNCTMFGVPVEPGCLADLLGGARQASGAEAAEPGSREGRSGDRPEATSSAPGASPGSPEGVPDLELPDLEPNGIPNVDGIKKGPKDRALEDLLDFLLR